MKKRIGLIYKGKKIYIDADACYGIKKYIGLMFKPKNTNALLFDFGRPVKKPIHSIFVFFPFVAVWLDDKNKVIEIRVIKPFTLLIRPKKRYQKLIEIPFNPKYQREITILVGIQKDLKTRFSLI